MIHSRYTKLVFAFLMSLFMSCLMSGVITFINLGLVDNFMSIWLEAYWKAFIVAFPIISFVAPFVQKLTKVLVKQEG